jgi:(4S)-4-hydroxy-5-phosphonooxypentane-2,3-dione isomerase
MLALIVTAKVKPSERERFLSVIEDDAISSVRDEPGCLRFEVLQDGQDQNTFYFFEVYRDEDALDAHTKTPHFARWAEAREAVLAEPPRRISTTRVVPRGESV